MENALHFRAGGHYWVKNHPKALFGYGAQVGIIHWNKTHDIRFQQAGGYAPFPSQQHLGTIQGY